ncbi:hypothetical protein B0W47_14210 [Komagataeibacter nataicola]|uniref:DUF2848 domain-containing protein n=1 Tax=Komagataeibacter nataicola TaxID=265960 RepID=A0A9N7CMR2_9PROT|nr:DUF2848 family protein [Komagataeibacter nataicola]AQU88418.1 hypothetical protein B0W47_14210 [Komagataeibacter nataicola]
MDIGEVRDVIVAGWAGRNPADVQHHIAELEMLGVAPPSTVPLFYRVSADILTQAENIVVVGEQTSGEAEPVLLRTATGLYVGIGSDHTDRFCEMGWLPSSPHGIAMCQNGRWKKRLRERTADEGYSDRR